MDWFTELFINEVKPALEHHSGLGGGSGSDDKMFILLDENGTEYPAVVVNEETVFDATANDIREGKTAATEDGVTVGTKDIPAYHTTEGAKVTTAGSNFVLPITNYDYTKLQAAFCPFNTSLENSVAADRIALNDSVYPVQSTIPESSITIDHENSRVDFGITNNYGKLCLIRYITYKEIY